MPAQLSLVRFDDCFITLCPHWPVKPTHQPTFTAPCASEVPGLEGAPVATRATHPPTSAQRSANEVGARNDPLVPSSLAYAATLAVLTLIAYILLRTLRLRRRSMLPRSPMKAGAAAGPGRSPFADSACTFSPLYRTDSDLDSEPGSARFRCASATKSVVSARSRASMR